MEASRDYVLNVEKEDMEMKVVNVDFVENEMVDSWIPKSENK